MVMMFIRNTAVVAAAIVLGIGAAPMMAQATSLYTYNGPAAGSFDNVNADRSEAGGTSRTVAAGPFSMSETDPVGGLGDFIAWCFEIDQNLVTSDTGTRTYTLGGVLDTDQRGRIEKLFDANYSTDIETSQPKAAAFQLAIWEVIYDDNFSLASGAFKSSTNGSPSSTAGQLRADADAFLTAAASYTGDRLWTITELSSATAQDLGTAAPIPLPAAAWLLLAASGGLLAAKRRRTQQAA
jgi:hypothetical protein